MFAPDSHTVRSWLTRCAAPLLGLMLFGCGDATGILVEVTSSDLSVPADINVVRFQVASSTGTSLDQAFAVASDWPHSLTIVPASSQDEEVTITVSGIRDGVMVIRRVVRVRFERGVTRRVEVVLGRDCVGVMCADGVDCRAGSCMGVVVPDAGPADSGPVDAGPNDSGPIDGGPTDGGPTDGGPVDAGPTDGGPMDGGPTDAGPLDAGPVDSGPVDSGPVDAGPTMPVCTDSASACQDILVISEFAYEGTGGAGDEFVEIYNRGSVTVNAGGVTVQYSSTEGSSLATRATVPSDTLIPAGGYYFMASMDFSGSGQDSGGNWSTGLAASRGTVLLEAGSATLDSVGWSNGASVRGEGTPIPDEDLGSGASFERKANSGSDATSMVSGADVTAGNGSDTGDNASDFILRPLRDPQNSSSSPEP